MSHTLNNISNNISIKAPSRRLPAEWEQVDAVIISWPHAATDWAYMLDEVTQCYVDMAHAIVPFARLIVVCPDVTIPQSLLKDIANDKIIYFTVPTNDTWMRDYGPITVVDEGGRLIYNDFKFNGWGLKFAADKDNLFVSRIFESKLLNGRYENRLGFVLEGGSIESDGHGVLMTTSECLLSPNRNGDLTKNEIEVRLKEYFGLRQVLWVDHGALDGDDTDSHIDTLARLVSDDTIMYTCTDDADDSHYEVLQAMKTQLREFRRLPSTESDEGLPYNLIELPMPDAIYDEDGERLPATYANFLFVNGAVLVPTYRQPRKDKLALQIFEAVFPDHEIVGVDCTALIKQHGSLHCATMQLPKGSVSF